MLELLKDELVQVLAAMGALQDSDPDYSDWDDMRAQVGRLQRMIAAIELSEMPASRLH